MTMEAYTLGNAEKISDDVMNIALFLKSGACNHKPEIHEQVFNEMFIKLEQLQGVLAYMRIAPDIVPMEQSKAKIDVSNH
ncbi:hypothetical protein KW487_11000 [Vibrio fluvialis]|nr:hypothetical protein [Vibrio fluvialis]MBY8103178.1 hypothetical protein [Vibrio fluvialis]